MKTFKVFVWILLITSLLLTSSPVFAVPLDQVVINAPESLSWLEGAQNPSGSWGTRHRIRDTAAAIEAVKLLNPSNEAILPGLAWLQNQPDHNNADLARVLIILARAGRPTSSLATELLTRQQAVESSSTRPNYPEGGWGIHRGYSTDCLHTSLALKALAAAGQGGVSRSAPVNYLLAAQNTDGGWGIGRGSASQIYITSLSLLALNDYKGSFSLQGDLDQGKQYLLNNQRPDHGWGQESSTAIATAMAIITLRTLGVGEAQLASAMNFLQNNFRMPDGSWSFQPYDTALALIALQQAEPIFDQKIYLPAVHKKLH